MSRNWIWGLAVAAICLSPLAVVPLCAHDKSDMTETIKLEDLADGESRTWGEGDNSVTATRKGDELILTVTGKAGEKTFRFKTGDDSHSLMTLDADGKSMVVVERQAGKLGDEEGTYIIKTGTDESGRMVIRGTGPDAMITTSQIKGSGPGAKTIQIMMVGGTVLRCPEGDATLTLEKGEEKTGPYFCPRHNLKMEPSEDAVFLKEMLLEGSTGSEAEEY